MALAENDLAILTARFGCARFGASRFGFIPCPEDVHGTGAEEPGEYVWKEVKPPTTAWQLITEDCVCGQRPVAGFSNVLCNAVGPVVFTDTSTPTEQVTFWYWDFGDGGTSNEQNPTHIYAAGYFTVTLYVSGDNGSSSATGYVSVMSALVASVNPNPVNIGEDATFTPTFTGGLAPHTYQWMFEQDTLWDDLVAYWNLNEASGTRRDARAEIHLLEVGDTASVAGKGGNAASFDPAGDHYLQSAQQADISGVNGITFTCWLNIRTGAPVGAIWFKNGAVFVSYMELNTANSDPKRVSMSISDDSGSLTTAGIIVGAYDTWYFVVAIYDPATMKVSISIDNGAFTVAANPTLAIPTISDDYGGGHVEVGGTEYGSVRSKSYIDEIGLWSRILTAGEITALYAAGAGKFYPGSTEEEPVYAYPTSGDKVASITVTSATGCTVSDTVDVTVEAGSTVTGTVTYDDPGGPTIWAGINVAMTVDAVPWPGGDAITDVNGVYTFIGVPAGAIDVSVSGVAPPGPRSGSNSGVTIPPATLTLDIYAVGV